MRGSGAMLSAALLATTAAAFADDPPGFVLARSAVEAHRGEEHASKMRVVWPELDDETPPEGSEVVLIRGFGSYAITRFVVRGSKVEAATVTVARSWFYNREGESFAASEFAADADDFARAWNAARRIRGARDERIGPAPADAREFEALGPWTSHQSIGWIRVRRATDGPAIHLAGLPSRRANREGVRAWEDIRDASILDLFAALAPGRQTRRVPAAVGTWRAFATDEVRRATSALGARADALCPEGVASCLLILGEVGDDDAAAAVEALVSAAAESSDPANSRLREHAAAVALRLRLRLHWNRDDAVRALRELRGGTWSREDQATWIRRTFKARDREGWSAFLVAEVTRPDARPADVAAATADLGDLPPARAVPLLHALLASGDPVLRVEAAITLHAVDPNDAAASTAVVAVALDRTIECTWRPDLTDRWCRSRALAAAIEWGGLTREALSAHLADPTPEQPAFLEEAAPLLPGHVAYPWLSEEMLAAWLRVLDGPPRKQIAAAITRLLMAGHISSKARMLAALDRLQRRIDEVGSETAPVSAAAIARLRTEVEYIQDGLDAPK